MATQKTISTIKPSATPLVLGILSIVCNIIPFVNIILGGIGMILVVYKMRKIQTNSDGYRYVTMATWSHLPGILRAGMIVSVAGIILGIPGTFIGILFWAFLLSGMF